MLYFYSVTMMMFINVLYISKLTFYTYVNSADLKLYLWFSGIHISIKQITVLYGMAIIIYILATLYLIKLIGRVKWRFILPVYAVICAFYMYTNSYDFIWKIYIANSQNLSSNIWRWIAETIYDINFFIIACAIVLPFIYLFVYYKKTKIYTKKRSAVSYAICIGLIDIYILFMFYSGISPLIAYKNIDSIGMPSITNENYLFMKFPMISVFLIIFIMFLILYFKPFDMYVLLRRRSIFLSNNNVNKNIRMILHTYKNAFIGIEKKMEIAQAYIDSNENVLASNQMSDIRFLADDSIARIERTLDNLRNPSMHYEFTNLLKCIMSALSKVSLPENIKVNYDDVPPDTLIFASEEHITEAFLNLILNAIDAINQKRPTTGHIDITANDEGDAVAINFSDNGCGIQKKNYKDIFKPFFSTKNTSTCNGIGLNYVERIISNHRGEIFVKSKVGSYTVFQIVLPACNKEEMYEKNQIGCM